jgi:hypothetical protein
MQPFYSPRGRNDNDWNSHRCFDDAIAVFSPNPWVREIVQYFFQHSCSLFFKAHHRRLRTFIIPSYVRDECMVVDARGTLVE